MLLINYTGNSDLIILDKKGQTNDITGKVVRVPDAKYINYISLCNIHATDSVTVMLSISGIINGVSETYKIIKDVKIPHGSTLVLEGKECSFDNSLYALKLKGSAGDSAIDVIIK
tara:strand:- start:143 stop:487 length:345 start_codon:yes stop_codon:yes gene_type:complete